MLEAIINTLPTLQRGILSAVDKRYQVFVSSTYGDLKRERQEVMQALLELDCMPAGMELFPAANEDQWSVIKQVIDDCDYYIVVSAGRYGSLSPDGVAYTEREYRYALDQGKPIIGFLHKDIDSLPANQTERDPEIRERLRQFHELLRQKMCKFWSTPEELGSVVSRSLIRLIKTNPATGWVRADSLPDQEAMSKIVRLRARVDDLERELEEASSGPPKGTEDLAQGDDIVELGYTFSAADKSERELSDLSTILGRSDAGRYRGTCIVTWNEVFSALSPLMIDEETDSRIQRALNSFVHKRERPVIKDREEFKDKDVSQLSVDQDDFQTVIVQFNALGLIQKSTRQRSVKDRYTYWTLTPYGETLMTTLRAIHKPKGIAEAS